jgi:predicted site-specific integrase-resolvase
MAELLSAVELAERLGVAYQTVLLWRRRGWIDGRRAIGRGGGHLVFDLAEVKQVLQERGRVLMPADGETAVRDARR